MKSTAQKNILRLYLYIVGYEDVLKELFINRIKKYFDEELNGNYELEVIDLLTHPQLAARDNILATPTLVRAYPEPKKKIVGDLLNKEKVLTALELKRSS